MSRRYIWAGEIIDTGDGGVNLDHDEIVGRLNELDRENTKLNAELTETIMAVADLMDENSDLRLKLAEFTAVRAVNKPFIPPKEADHDNSNS